MTTSELERRTEILALLTAGERDAPLVERVCEVSAWLLGVSGAGMCLVGGAQQQIIVHGTDPLIEELEDLQISLGEGPCIEAVRTGYPVHVPDLGGRRASGWREYADQALARGVRALFAFPLRAGGTPIGALDLYRMDPGALSPRQTDDARSLAEIATRAMLAQQDSTHLDGSVSALRWLSAGRQPGSGGRGRAVDLGITVSESLAAPAGGSNDALRPATVPDRPDRARR